MKNERIKLVIADDHHILLDGLKAMLDLQPDLTVKGFFDNGQQLYDALETLMPLDVAVLDINMPGLNGLELCIKIKEDFKDLKCIMLSMHDDEGHIMDLVDAGADGYLLKNAGDKELLEAIRSVAGGRMYFSEEVANKIEAVVLKRQKHKQEPASPQLTPREVEILKLIADEYNNSRIAEALFISERTVETHRKNMMRKTGNNNVIGLIRYGREKGLL